MITIQQALFYGGKELNQKGIRCPFLESRIFLRDIVGISERDLITNRESIITNDDFQKFEKAIARRKKFEPVAYITNKKEFWRDIFYVNESTLIPRPDSELIIETILKHIPNDNINLKFLDLGTGSGCLIISVLKEYKFSSGIGIDIDINAVKVAQKNKNILKNKKRLEFRLGDFSYFNTSIFDVIICNPPYVDRSEINNLQMEITSYEPHQAIFADEKGTNYYSKIITNLKKNYKYDQKIFFEIGIYQSEFLCNLLKNNDYTVLEVAKDISGIPRCIAAKRN